ncbi:Uncharacterised protein [Candidatus Tiddalikarchaeum anstoanum]|nr:Uncharacterised protein [Candidatus Tiddalikarchaeum anstoanum]
MAIFGLGKKKADKSPISDKNLKNPYENLKGEDLVKKSVTEEEVGSEEVTGIKFDSRMNGEDPFSIPLPNVTSKGEPFKADILTVNDEISDIKVQLKSMSVQLNNVIKLVEDLEKKRLKNS